MAFRKKKTAFLKLFPDPVQGNGTKTAKDILRMVDETIQNEENKEKKAEKMTIEQICSALFILM